MATRSKTIIDGTDILIQNARAIVQTPKNQKRDDKKIFQRHQRK